MNIFLDNKNTTTLKVFRGTDSNICLLYTSDAADE